MLTQYQEMYSIPLGEGELHAIVRTLEAASPSRGLEDDYRGGLDKLARTLAQVHRIGETEEEGD